MNNWRQRKEKEAAERECTELEQDLAMACMQLQKVENERDAAEDACDEMEEEYNNMKKERDDVEREHDMALR